LIPLLTSTSCGFTQCVTGSGMPMGAGGPLGAFAAGICQ
jgi:hypothetical protein